MPPPAPLGNFLSGMETLAVTLQEQPGVDLGNFLSGMETHGVVPVVDPPFGLGNFLSGMETEPLRQGKECRAYPLETSLVEWKRARCGDCWRRRNAPWKLP